MIIKVNPHKLEIKKELVNEREIDITKCLFEFDEEITSDYVKEAYFTFEGTSYKVIITNNECEIPNEVLVKKGQIELGVVCYLVENDTEIKRYNPSPVYFDTLKGSLKDYTENTEPITPSEMEQYEQALNDGLNELDNALDDLQEKVDSGYFKGEKGDTGEQGPQGIQGERGLQGEQGIQGVKGDKGEKGDKGDPGEKGQDGTNGTNGQDGRDGYVQYTAGNNITIENNVISATGGDTSYYVIDDNSSTNPFLFSDKKPGIYAFYKSSNIYEKKIYFKYSSENTTTSDIELLGKFLIILTETSSSTPNNQPIAVYVDAKTGDTQLISRGNNSIGCSIAGIDARLSDRYFVKTSNQTLNKKVTFTSYLPESSIVPTTDDQLANKKYVDDAVAGAGGGLTPITENTNIWDLDEGIYDVAPSVNLKYNAKNFKITVGDHGLILFVEKTANNKTPFYAMGRGIVSGYSTTNHIIIGSAQNDNYGTYELYDANKLNTAVATTGDYYIYGKFSFSNYLPESSIVPTTDKQLVNKKYVDDAIAQAISNL